MNNEIVFLSGVHVFILSIRRLINEPLFSWFFSVSCEFTSSSSRNLIGNDVGTISAFPASTGSRKQLALNTPKLNDPRSLGKVIIFLSDLWWKSETKPIIRKTRIRITKTYRLMFPLLAGRWKTTPHLLHDNIDNSSGLSRISEAYKSILKIILTEIQREL